MADDPFERDHAPVPGVVETLAPGLRVVTAGNPGPMTFTGTRSYILGEGRVAVIDPGPADAAHLAALVTAVAGERVVAVLVTHAHRDHSGGARAFAERVAAPLLAHGDPAGARSAAMARLAAEGLLGGGEGIDSGFAPDERIGDDAVISGSDWTLTAAHTPGHLSDHLSFAWAEGQALFSGDTVMGWGTTLISPPDGDLTAFRASLARLRIRSDRVYYPGHGAPITDPVAMLDWLAAHRDARDRQILAVLAAGPATPAEIVAEVYAGLDPRLAPAAARNVLAHLIDLGAKGRAHPLGPLSADARFALA